MYDYIVIGAGYGGLSTAALLAREGLSVLILEGHTNIGGCASSFGRKGFAFEVGATTLSGVLPKQPLGRLFDELSITPEIKKIDPGVIIYSEGKKITRHSDKDAWIETAVEVFQSEKQKVFWDKVFHTNDLIWKFIAENETINPRKLKDYITLMKLSNLKYYGLLFGLSSSTKKVIDKLGLENRLFRKFLNEQLLITTQSNNFSAPFVTSAVGLAYPSETYYPYGGMIEPLRQVKDKFFESGGELEFKKKVSALKRQKDYYEVETTNGKTYKAKGIISNIPIWNMAEITEGKIRKYFMELSGRYSFAWGSFTLYFAVEDIMPLETAYYQIHTEKIIPHCSAHSFFVSFSLPDDKMRAPEGWRTVTISTHTEVANWIIKNKDEYNSHKEETTQYLLHKFFETFPKLKEGQMLHLLSGTPNSFEFFTGRYNGFVGGIPHSVKNNLLKIPTNKTPFDNLFMVGDTVFPGQGVPSVVTGAFNVLNFIRK